MSSARLALPYRPARARTGTSLTFLLCGTGFGIWAALIPVVSLRHGIDATTLGLVLLTLAGAGLLAMPVCAAALRRFGAGRTTAFFALGFGITLAFPLLAPSLPALFAAAFLFGLFNGGLDVAMNAHGSAVETLRARPLMSSFHGFWSIGGLVGAGIGGLLIGLDLTGPSGILLVTLAALALAIVALPRLVEVPEAPAAPPQAFQKPRLAAIGLGLIALLCFVSEGAVIDWSALYLREEGGASPAFASGGFAAFALAMAACRFLGDRVVARVGAVSIVRYGGLLIALGMTLVILAPWPLLAAAGFALLGLGASNIVPVVFGAAGRIPGLPTGAGVATVSAIGYAGFLALPPLLGFLADHLSLRAALAIIPLAGIAIALGAGAVRERREPSVER